MRNTYLLITLVVCAAATASVTAEDMQPDALDTSVVVPVPDTGASDPTLLFFSALSACTPGTYTEKNILTEDVGQTNLTQHIIGPSDDKLTCNAMLMTPDSRVLTCAFPIQTLTQLNDQQFLEGVLEANADEPGQKSIKADMLWSNMKAENCSLDSAS